MKIAGSNPAGVTNVSPGIVERWCLERAQLDKRQSTWYDLAGWAGVAQLVEHLLAKEKVAGSSPVSRSIL